MLFEKGQGVAQNYPEAARWYLKAAEQGDPEAQYSIGALHQAVTGVARDLEEAQKWYASVIANPRAGDPASALRQRARQRFTALDRVREQIVPFKLSWFPPYNFAGEYYWKNKIYLTKK